MVSPTYHLGNNAVSASKESNAKCHTCCAPKSDLSAAGWQSRYDEGKTGWDRGEANPMLTHWLQSDRLQPCRILVPGCGRGHEAIVLAQAGFEVTAVDFAASAVEHLMAELEQRNLNATVLQSDLFACSHAGEFDAVYEQTCLCAIDPSQWETYEQLLACWLRPGGNLFAMFMQSDQPDGPPFSCELPRMKELFHAKAWHWHDEPVRVEHPMGMHELGCVLTRQENE